MRQISGKSTSDVLVGRWTGVLPIPSVFVDSKQTVEQRYKVVIVGFHCDLLTRRIWKDDLQLWVAMVVQPNRDGLGLPSSSTIVGDKKNTDSGEWAVRRNGNKISASLPAIS